MCDTCATSVLDTRGTNGSAATDLSTKHEPRVLCVLQLAGRADVAKKHYESFRNECIKAYGDIPAAISHFEVSDSHYCRISCVLFARDVASYMLHAPITDCSAVPRGQRLHREKQGGGIPEDDHLQARNIAT